MADQLGIEVGSRFQLGAQRIDHSGFGLGAVQNRLDEAGIELRLGQNATNP